MISGGTRGGQDQFKWEDVKNDKYRENYLGHSVLAPVGRWQKGKDLTWYAKSKVDQAAALEEERRRMKDLDDDLLNAALGIKATKKWTGSASLDSDDLKHLLARGATAELRANDEEEVTERTKGVGAAPAKFHEHIERKSAVEKELEKYKKDESSELVREEEKQRGGNVIALSSKESLQHDEPAASRSHAIEERQREKRHRSDNESSSSSDEESTSRHKKSKREHKKKEKKEKKKHDRDRDHKKHKHRR